MREERMSEENIIVELDRIFYPRSVALLGASNKQGKIGRIFLERFIETGFKEFYPVNPGESEVLGVRAYPKIADIPGPVDADSLMNQDKTGFWDTSTNRPNSLDPDYKDNNWMKSPRVVRIPVYNPDSSSNGGLNTPPGGSLPFQPLGFIGFWVQDVLYDPGTNLGTVVGRYVTVEGFGGDEGEASGGTVLNIRLVE